MSAKQCSSQRCSAKWCKAHAAFFQSLCVHCKMKADGYQSHIECWQGMFVRPQLLFLNDMAQLVLEYCFSMDTKQHPAIIAPEHPEYTGHYAVWSPPLLKLKTNKGKVLLNKELDETRPLTEYSLLLLGLDRDPFPTATPRDLHPGLYLEFQGQKAQGQVFKIQEQRNTDLRASTF